MCFAWMFTQLRWKFQTKQDTDCTRLLCRSVFQLITNISGVHGAELFVIKTWIRWDSVAISGNVTRPQHGTQQLGILIGACCYQQKGADTQRSRRRLLFTFHTMALGPSTPDPFGQEKFTELKYT